MHCVEGAQRLFGQGLTKQNTTAQRILLFIGDRWSAFFLVLMLVGFSLGAPNFFAFKNFTNILYFSTTYALLAAGETFVISYTTLTPVSENCYQIVGTDKSVFIGVSAIFQGNDTGRKVDKLQLWAGTLGTL